MADDFRSSVLLSFMRALWQHVLPDLRGVTMSLASEPNQELQLRSRILYEGAVGELQHDCVWEAESELRADFPEGMSIEFFAVPSASRDLERSEEWVYVRWEPLV